MCRHAKNNTEIRNIESKYRDWQSAGLVQYFIIDTQGYKWIHGDRNENDHAKENH